MLDIHSDVQLVLLERPLDSILYFFVLHPVLEGGVEDFEALPPHANFQSDEIIIEVSQNVLDPAGHHLCVYHILFLCRVPYNSIATSFCGCILDLLTRDNQVMHCLEHNFGIAGHRIWAESHKIEELELGLLDRVA